MRQQTMSASPKSTMAFLIALDPAFETELEGEDSEQLTHHQIMILFAQYFGANRDAFTAKQLQRLGEWLNGAIAAGGELENAVSTCLLEHSRQLKIDRVLAPYLSPLAKERSHA